jgi:hypothetical protein
MVAASRFVIPAVWDKSNKAVGDYATHLAGILSI